MRALLCFLLFHFMYQTIVAQGEGSTGQIKIIQSSSLTDTIIFYKGSFTELKKAALKSHKPFMLVFGAAWCAPCHRLHEEILNYPYIANYINNHFLPFYIDLDSFEGLELNNKFKVIGLPTIKFFGSDGKDLETINGYFDKAYFMKKLRKHAGEVAPH